MMTDIERAGAYASVNGLELYYEIHGSGRPLVLLHGGLLTIDLSFGQLIPTLAKSHRVIAVETQGHGRTADIDREPSLSHLAGDIAGLLDHLDIPRADFFGFSLGALVALELGITRPELVDRLVLAAAHFRQDGYHDDIRDPASHPDSTRMPTGADFAAMQAAYVQVAPRPDDFMAFMEKQSAVVLAFKGWSDEQLRALTASTLLAIGDHDFVRIEHAAEMLDLIPNAQLTVIPGATHMGLLQHTEVLLPAVETFLAETTG